MTDDPNGAETFEQLLRQLDEAVNSLEAEELSLEEALERYESAVQLASRCAEFLDKAELRIREIDKTLDRIDRNSDENAAID